MLALSCRCLVCCRTNRPQYPCLSSYSSAGHENISFPGYPLTLPSAAAGVPCLASAALVLTIPSQTSACMAKGKMLHPVWDAAAGNALLQWECCLMPAKLPEHLWLHSQQSSPHWTLTMGRPDMATLCKHLHQT